MVLNDTTRGSDRMIRNRPPPALNSAEEPMNASVSPARTYQDSTPVHDAHSLTQGGQQARIVLDGKVYSLRITRAGKLILTK